MGRRTTVNVPFSNLEWQAIEEAARRAGITPREYIRHASIQMARAVTTDHRPTYTPVQLTSIYKRAARQGKTWTEVELRERGLPLYWCEDWVRTRLAKGATRGELAAEAGCHEQTIASFLRRVYDLGVHTIRPGPITKREEARQLYAAGHSYAEIATRLNLNESSVRAYTIGLGRERQQQNQKGFDQVMATVPNWNGTRAEIAEKAFGGNGQAATHWLRQQVNLGRIQRLQKGKYALTISDPGDGETTATR